MQYHHWDVLEKRMFYVKILNFVDKEKGVICCVNRPLNIG